MRWLETCPLLLGGLLTAFTLLAAGGATTAAAESDARTSQTKPGPLSGIQGGPPRKVLIGTSIQGFWDEYPGLEKRLAQLRGLVEEMVASAAKSHPGRGLDLVVIPENAVTSGRAAKASERAVKFSGQVHDTFAELARKYKTYLVVTLDMVEDTSPVTYSNAAILLDRTGKQVGIYRKVHPVSALGSRELEGGLTPGKEFPVFETDFGKVGIQICYDMVYDDGWAELARKGAELVVWPSASPAMFQPASRARQHGYYIVSSTFRHNATVFEPTGLVAGQVLSPGRVLVKEIDLSYILLPWSQGLENGMAFRKKYGDRAGFRYFEAEDFGIFWSNDPKTPIAQMVRELGLAEANADIERNRQMQDQARGGPPSK